MLVYICEDNKEHLNSLCEMINKCATDINCTLTLEKFYNPENLIGKLNKRLSLNHKLPDIIFSDIKMSGMNGIDLGKRLVKIAPDVTLIYITAYEEYAIQGYETRAYRYLLKPVNPNEITRILKDIHLKSLKNKLLILKDNEEETVVPIKDIRYISAEDKYSIIHTINGNFLDRRSLNYFEEHLADMPFFRVHRKFLVNMRFHKSLKAGNTILDNDEKIPISRRKEALYHNCLLNLLEGDLLR